MLTRAHWLNRYNPRRNETDATLDSHLYVPGTNKYGSEPKLACFFALIK
jgi:hypothetical protein